MSAPPGSSNLPTANMLLSTILTAALSTTAAVARWGDSCGPFYAFGAQRDGVCVWTSECHAINPGTRQPATSETTRNRCPNDPPGVRCCAVGSCIEVIHNKCPGGADVKCHKASGWCLHTNAGVCPGGHNFMWASGVFYQDPKTRKRRPCDPYTG
ncbi:hypothetical protein Q8F55_008251 [Vanrija albida]|uniref:Secreted protein n=1 Tax=Vanrija albida TaxID=181172 RepID=A0ABR3PVP3_9TREE